MDAKVCSLGKTAICDLRVHSLNFLCALTFDERVRAPCMIPDYLLLREEELVLVSPQAHKPPQGDSGGQLYSGTVLDPSSRDIWTQLCRK